RVLVLVVLRFKEKSLMLEDGRIKLRSHLASEGVAMEVGELVAGAESGVAASAGTSPDLGLVSSPGSGLLPGDSCMPSGPRRSSILSGSGDAVRDLTIIPEESTCTPMRYRRVHRAGSRWS